MVLKGGIKVTRDGLESTTCGINSISSFSAAILCDKDIMDQGAAEIVKVEGADTCNPTVYMKHKAGCVEFDPDDYSWIE